MDAHVQHAESGRRSANSLSHAKAVYCFHLYPISVKIRFVTWPYNTAGPDRLHEQIQMT